MPTTVAGEKSNHHALSPEEVSVAPDFQGAGLAVNTAFPVALSINAYCVPGVNDSDASNPV